MAHKQMGHTPPDKWEWYGMPGHFICSEDCVHHLCTRVGRYLISTVGDMRHVDCATGKRKPKETIGCERFYETYVFELERKFGRCDCGCNMPKPASMLEIDSLPANDAATADKNHMKLCRKYAKAALSKVSP